MSEIPGKYWISEHLLKLIISAKRCASLRRNWTARTFMRLIPALIGARIVMISRIAAATTKSPAFFHGRAFGCLKKNKF